MGNLTKVHDGACGGGNEDVVLPLGNGMKDTVAVEMSVVSVYASVHIFCVREIIKMPAAFILMPAYIFFSPETPFYAFIASHFILLVSKLYSHSICIFMDDPYPSIMLLHCSLACSLFFLTK